LIYLYSYPQVVRAILIPTLGFKEFIFDLYQKFSDGIIVTTVKGPLPKAFGNNQSGLL